MGQGKKLDLEILPDWAKRDIGATPPPPPNRARNSFQGYWCGSGGCRGWNEEEGEDEEEKDEVQADDDDDDDNGGGGGGGGDDDHDDVNDDTSIYGEQTLYFIFTVIVAPLLCLPVKIDRNVNDLC